MFVPKKLKYRKSHRLRGGTEGTATKGTLVSFGAYGLKAIEGGNIMAMHSYAQFCTNVKSLSNRILLLFP